MSQELIIGCGEWGFRELPMEEHFEISQQFGFKFLEFGIGGGQVGRLPEEPSAEDISNFKKLAETYEIECPFCCLENDFTLVDPQVHERMVEKTLKQIQVAKDCGATHVRLFAGFTPAEEITEEIWERMIDAFKRTHDLCESLELTIAIETHGKIIEGDQGEAIHVHTVSTSPEWLERLLQELPETVGFNYDPGNLKAVNPDDRTYLLDLLDSRINYCHLKDWTRRGDGWEAVAIGDDDLDYDELIEKMSFRGVYLIEYEPIVDLEDGIRRSLEYLRSATDGFSFEVRE